MKIVNKDILTVDHGVIVHQVNCRGVMGAGLAKAIADKYPIVKTQYLRKFYSMGWQLGNTQFVSIHPDLYVCNLAGQVTYGRENIRYTNYDALKIGFAEVHNFAFEHSLQVYLPYGIGCGLANGDWPTVKEIIVETIPNAIICKKENV